MSDEALPLSFKLKINLLQALKCDKKTIYKVFRMRCVPFICNGQKNVGVKDRICASSCTHIIIGACVDELFTFYAQAHSLIDHGK